MSKQNLLNESDFKDYQIHPVTMAWIKEKCGQERNALSSCHILDWGCGRGRAVAWLRTRSYNAYGVDVDLGPIENGRPFFTSKGWDAKQILQRLNEQGKSDFQDCMFDIVFSDQVLEHVNKLGVVATELHRVLKPGGIGIHVFPSRWRLLEPHLGMPFIHWLPKSGPWRRLAIYSLLLLGIDPAWKETHGFSKWATSKIYRDYTVRKTYYRRLPQVKDDFEREGFKVFFVGDNPNTATTLQSERGIQRFYEWIHRNFGSVRMVIIKTNGILNSGESMHTGKTVTCAV